MPTIRHRIPRTQRVRLGLEAVAAYRAGDEMELHRVLRLRPWQVSPLHAVGDCPYSSNSAGGKTWADSVLLREALLDGLHLD